MDLQELTLTNLSAAQMEGLIPKYIHLREALRRDLATLDSGARLPSVAQIRKRYSVSQSTFDRAIEGLRNEGVVRTHQGKGMFTTKMAKTRRVGLIFGRDVFTGGQVSNQLLLQGLQKQALQRDHLLYYFFENPESDDVDHTPQQLAMEVQAGRLDGLLASSGRGENQDGWDHLTRYGLPFVAFSHRGKLPNRVCIDWAAIARLGTEELLRQGCKSLAFWHRNPYYADQTSAAFMQALAYGGGRTRPEWNIIAPSGTPVDVVAEATFHEQWESWDEKPDGIVCADDIMTQGLVRAAKQRCLSLTDDLQIASHANKGAHCWGEAPVVRLEFDLDRLAAAMVNRLDQLISGKQPEPDVLLIGPNVVRPT